MAAVGPFEKHPRLAVACSGGPDSMALTILMHEWARARSGGVTALIVDHGIRKNAAAEARLVAKRLAQRNIPHKILKHTGKVFEGDIQASARKVRYALLSDWCAAHSHLHLGIAHHREDQAETVLLRLARGSGLDGLAAMASVSETRHIRHIRPLLNVPRSQLRATLNKHGVCFVEDPSNDDRDFARVRMRALAAPLSAEGMSPYRLAATATRLARARAALEGSVAALLARAGTFFPQGYGLLAFAPLRRAPEEIALRGLSRTLTYIGGKEYPSRLAHLERLYEWILRDPMTGGKTLSGCRILARGSSLLVCRESAAAKTVLPARGEVFWDNRFRLHCPPRGTGEVKRLGSEGWREIVAADPGLRNTKIPAVVRPSLPAIWSAKGVEAVPHLGFTRQNRNSAIISKRPVCFAPRQPLIPASFTLQKGGYTLSKLRRN